MRLRMDRQMEKEKANIDLPLFFLVPSVAPTLLIEKQSNKEHWTVKVRFKHYSE